MANIEKSYKIKLNFVQMARSHKKVREGKTS